MPANLEELKKKREQLNAKIQQAENREKANNKKAQDRTKILVGAAILGFVKNKPSDARWLIDTLAEFYKENKRDLEFLVSNNKQGSETLLKLIKPNDRTADQSPGSSTQHHTGA